MEAVEPLTVIDVLRFVASVVIVAGLFVKSLEWLGFTGGFDRVTPTLETWIGSEEQAQNLLARDGGFVTAKDFLAERERIRKLSEELEQGTVLLVRVRGVV
jgi:hypothetical protein